MLTLAPVGRACCPPAASYGLPWARTIKQAANLSIRSKLTADEPQILSCGRGPMLCCETAARARTLHDLNLEKVIRLRQIKRGSAAGTALDRRTRFIEPAFNEVEIADGIAKDPGTIGSSAGMKGAGFVRCFVQHHLFHRGMMQVAQRSELSSGCQWTWTLTLSRPCSFRSEQRFESSATCAHLESKGGVLRRLLHQKQARPDAVLYRTLRTEGSRKILVVEFNA